MTILDSFRKIEERDKSSMLELIESFPDQCQDAKRIGDEFVLPEAFRVSYRNIVCAGLGGSAIGADIARSYAADEAEIPIFVNRNYTLPNFVDKETLVIASSYSGDTEESLAAYHDARTRGAKIIVITSGGRLDKMAEDDDVPRINIPTGFPPRAALGYSFFPLLILLTKLGIIKDQGAFIDEAIHNLRELKDSMIGYKIRHQRNFAKKIANEILNKFIVIYGGQDHIDSVVTRWRGQFAENSKTLGSSQIFPEMNHNEIVGWENPKKVLKNFVVIILRDSSDNPRTARRMDVTKKILEKDKIRVIEVHSIGKGLLARIFSLIYIGDFISFYLAILNGIDPTPVERVAYLKKELAKA